MVIWREYDYQQKVLIVALIFYFHCTFEVLVLNMNRLLLLVRWLTAAENEINIFYCKGLLERLDLATCYE